MDRIRRSRQRVHRADNNASADGARFGDRRRECGCAQYARGVSAHVQSMQGVKIEECSLAWHAGPFPTEVIRFERLGPSPADAARCDNRSPVKEPLGSSQGGSTSICLWALLDLRLCLVCSRTFRRALAARLCCKGSVEKSDAATVLLLLWRHASVMIRSFAPCAWMIRSHSSLFSKFSSTLSADVFVAMGCFTWVF